MKKKWLFGFIIMLMLSIGYSIPQHVHASSALHVEAEIGVENRVKRDMPTFINLTITNNGDPFSGDLVVDAETRYNVGAALVFPVDIATGETKKMKIYLDGFSERYAYTTPIPDLFHFFEGGIEEGKKVKYEGDHNVKPRIFEPYTSIGLVVTTKKDEVSALDRMDTYANDEVELFYINDKNHAYLADDARALSMLNFIIFDDVAVQDLSEKQQQALFTWVQQGGRVAFPANEQGANAAGIFAEHLPLTFGQEKVEVATKELSKYVAANAQIDPVKVYEATLNDGAKERLVADGKLLAGVKPLGKGEVIQLTYPLNDPTISKISSYGRLMVDTLDVNNLQIFSEDMFKYGNAPQWVHTNELFETFRINMWLIMGGIIVYIAIIGPIIYMILKRKDKREKMWFIVPILAVLTSLLFFVYGARDRLFNPQMEQMAMYEVQEDGTVIGTFTTALLSNRSGDFTFKVSDGASVSASTEQDLSSTALHLNSYVKETAEGTELTLRNMDYWSVDSIVGETVLSDVGQFTSDLTLENGKIFGSVTNNLPVDMQEVTILAGRDEIVLGTVKAGETLSVNEAYDKKFLAKPYQYDMYNYGYPDQIEDIKSAKLKLFKNTAIFSNETHKGPLLVGWSDVSLVPVELDGSGKQNTLSYFVQQIEPNVVMSGEVTFNEDDVVSYIESESGNGWGQIEGATTEAYMGEGDYIVYYDFMSIDEMKKLDWKELSVKYDSSLLNVELYNHKTGEYLELEGSEHKVAENIALYLEEGENMQLRFRVSRIGIDNGELINLPTFTLKGEPKQ